MSRGEAFPILHCTAIAPVRAFYEHVFGATLGYQFPPDGEATFLTLRVGDASIALALGTEPAMYGETPLPATGHAVDLCIYVDDLAATLARAGDVVVPATDTPWGERVAYLRDPQGTLLLVIQAET